MAHSFSVAQSAVSQALDLVNYLFALPTNALFSIYKFLDTASHMASPFFMFTDDFLELIKYISSFYLNMFEWVV